MNVVERHNTPVTEEQAREAFRAAYMQEFNQAPDIDEAALLLALMWLETKHGESVQNFSPGNITAAESYQGDAWRPPWFELGDNPTERNRALHEQMLQGKAPRAFRAYQTLNLGMLDFLRTLRTSFPEVLIAAKGADPDAFRVALSRNYSGDYKNTAATSGLTTYMRAFGGAPKASRSPTPRPAPSVPAVPGSGSSQQSLAVASLPVLVEGSRGPAVRLWAKLIGLRKGNDLYDATLIAATKRWQEGKGFTGRDVDGEVGPKTWGTVIA